MIRPVRLAPARAARMAAVCIAIVAACNREHHVGVDVAMAGDVAAAAHRIELRLYDVAACPTVDAFLAGTDDPVLAQTFLATGHGDPIGALEAGPWSFAALVRGDDCRAIGYGCATITIGREDAVSVPVVRLGTDVSCTPVESCADGRCLPDGGVPPPP